MVTCETAPVRAGYQLYRGGGGSVEGLTARRRATYSEQGYMQEQIVSECTPFFHVDLVAAVRATEILGLREEEEESESGESGPSRGSQGEILIDLG